MLSRIGAVLVGGGLTVSAVDVPRTALTVLASDHLPVIVDVEMDPAAGWRPRSAQEV